MPDIPDRATSRAEIVKELRGRLLRDSFPRLTVLMIVLLSGGGAFSRFRR
jgi:hypothetical protein